MLYICRSYSALPKYYPDFSQWKLNHKMINKMCSVNAFRDMLKFLGTSSRFYLLLWELCKTRTITKVSVMLSVIQINETTMMLYSIQENTLICWPQCLLLMALLQVSSSQPFKYNKHRNFRKKTGEEKLITIKAIKHHFEHVHS